MYVECDIEDVCDESYFKYKQCHECMENWICHKFVCNNKNCEGIQEYIYKCDNCEKFHILKENSIEINKEEYDKINKIIENTNDDYEIFLTLIKIKKDE